MGNPKKKISMTRRQALGMLGKGIGLAAISNPLQLFTDSLIDGMMTKAEAQTTGTVTPRNYVVFHLSGGPPRWYFDLPLNPYASNVSTWSPSNPGIMNSFLGNNGANAGLGTYKLSTFNVNGTSINMPILWNSVLPTSSGGSVPMSTLLSNLLVIRGVASPQSSHFLGIADKLQPSSSSPSLNGLVADASSTPIPAVGLATQGGSGAPDFQCFRSGSGLGQNTIVSSTGVGANTAAVSSLLQPFNKLTDTLPPAYLNRRNAIAEIVNSALDKFGTQAQTRSPGSLGLFTARSNAEKILSQGVTTFINQYPSTLARYNTILAKCADYVTYPIPGLTDKPILPGTYNAAQIKLNGFAATNSDLRTMYFSPTNKTTAYVVNMAESFAISEILILNKLSSAVVAQIPNGGVGNVDWGSGPSNQLGWIFDEHTGGMVVSTLMTSHVYRCFAACLYEFSQKLQAQGMWEETVVQLGAEFPRTPHADGSGTEHGGMANLFTLFSGAITKPIVIGNVISDSSQTNPNNPDLIGCWGESAQVTVAGASVNLLNGHATSTVSDLLRVRHIMANNSSLITASDSTGVQAAVDLAKNV